MIVPQWVHHRTCPHVPLTPSLCGSSTAHLYHKSCRSCPMPPKNSRRSLLDKGSYCTPVGVQGFHDTPPRVPHGSSLCGSSTEYLHHKSCRRRARPPNHARRSLLDNDVYCMPVFRFQQDTLRHHAGHVFLHHDVVAVHPLHNACCMHPNHSNHAFDKGYGDAAATT